MVGSIPRRLVLKGKLLELPAVPANRIIKDIMEGSQVSKRHVKTLKKELGVESFKQGAGRGSRWYWRTPESKSARPASIAVAPLEVAPNPAGPPKPDAVGTYGVDNATPPGCSVNGKVA